MNKKLKFLLLFAIIAMLAVACGNTDPTDENNYDTEFLNKVKGKSATGEMGPITINYAWSADGKTLTFTVPAMGGGASKPTVTTYTFEKAETASKAVYNDGTIIEITSSDKGTLTSGGRALSFTFK